jgi:uncharacterized protein (DUF1697 family)
LLGRTGLSARVVLLPRAEFSAVVAENPLQTVASDPKRLLAAIPQDVEMVRAVKRLERDDWGAEALATGRRAAYLWCANGILASELLPAVDRIMGEGTTTRNWATIMRIEARFRGDR